MKNNKTLTEIIERAKECAQDKRDTFDETRQSILDVEEIRDNAKKVLETTTNVEEYDAAEKEYNAAASRIAFLNRILSESKPVATMREEEYTDHVNTCLSLAEKARDTYRKIADECITKLVEGRDAYTQALKEINEALELLDDSTNVLQAKYPYRISNFTDGRKAFDRDATEWKNHAVRVAGQGRELEQFTHVTDDNGTTLHVGKYVGAWKAVDYANMRNW